MVSGPIFKKRINIIRAEKITRDQHCFLDIAECELAEMTTGDEVGNVYEKHK